MGISRRDWKTPGKIAEQISTVAELPELIEEAKANGWALKAMAMHGTADVLVVVFDTWENLHEGERGR